MTRASTLPYLPSTDERWTRVRISTGRKTFDCRCRTCGGLFVWVQPDTRAVNPPRYCSEDCRPSSPKFPRTCIACGEEFKVFKANSRTVFCRSSTCLATREHYHDRENRLLRERKAARAADQQRKKAEREARGAERKRWLLARHNEILLERQRIAERKTAIEEWRRGLEKRTEQSHMERAWASAARAALEERRQHERDERKQARAAWNESRAEREELRREQRRWERDARRALSQRRELDRLIAEQEEEMAHPEKHHYMHMRGPAVSLDQYWEDGDWYSAYHGAVHFDRDDDRWPFYAERGRARRSLARD